MEPSKTWTDHFERTIDVVEDWRGDLDVPIYEDEDGSTPIKLRRSCKWSMKTRREEKTFHVCHDDYDSYSDDSHYNLYDGDRLFCTRQGSQGDLWRTGGVSKSSQDSVVCASCGKDFSKGEEGCGETPSTV